MNQFFQPLALLIGICLLQGMSPSFVEAQRVDGNYGRARGTGYSKSVNGTSVFAEMFRKQGRTVKYDNELNPRMENFDTIVWFPASFSTPSQAVIDRIEQWLSMDTNRTLIYVERDYDATITYWEKALANAKPADAPKIRRELARVQIVYRSSRSGGGDSCDWYQVDSRGPQRRCTQFEGPWANRFQSANSEIYLSSDLTVPFNQAKYQSEVWLSSNNEPLITKFYPPPFTDRLGGNHIGGKIVLMSNGSMLLNLPLVNKENRLIASDLIDACEWGDVLFLESSEYMDPPINETEDDENDLGLWKLLNEKPLCYILPQVSILGLIFCFVFFPIFGRPRKSGEKENTDFSSHIKAMASLLSRTKNRDLARQKVQHCHEMMHRAEKNRN